MQNKKLQQNTSKLHYFHRFLIASHFGLSFFPFIVEMFLIVKSITIIWKFTQFEFDFSDELKETKT